jgi:hypothetical protein
MIKYLLKESSSIQKKEKKDKWQCHACYDAHVRQFFNEKVMFDITQLKIKSQYFLDQLKSLENKN